MALISASEKSRLQMLVGLQCSYNVMLTLRCLHSKAGKGLVN